jgi:hypothetical protein
MRRMSLSRSLCLSAALLCACSPVLDWRQVKPAGMGLEALFPCRPANLARHVELQDRRLEMVVHACTAAHHTFAVGSLVMPDVREVPAVLDALREAAARNLGDAAQSAQPFEVLGMTPNPRAGLSILTGRRPDGSAVVEHVLVFARGERVYQAMVVGNKPDAETVAAFFAGLKLMP